MRASDPPEEITMYVLDEEQEAAEAARIAEMDAIPDDGLFGSPTEVGRCAYCGRRLPEGRVAYCGRGCAIVDKRDGDE
jgi:hypothetical protein